MKSVFCVASESSGSGAVDWWSNPHVAAKQFHDMENSKAFANDTLTRFDLQVPDHMVPGEITEFVDDAMWNLSYHCLKRRVGTDGIHAPIAGSTAHCGEASLPCEASA